MPLLSICSRCSWCPISHLLNSPDFRAPWMVSLHALLTSFIKLPWKLLSAFTKTVCFFGQIQVTGKCKGINRERERCSSNGGWNQRLNAIASILQWNTPHVLSPWFSRRSQWDWASVAYRSNLLVNTLHWLFSLSCLLLPTPPPASWDHLPNRQPTPMFFSKIVLFGGNQLK